MHEITVLPPESAALLLPLLAQVQDMHLRAHPDIFHGDAPQAQRDAFLRDFIARPNVTALGCRDEDGEVIGYLIFERQTRDASALKCAERVGFLHQICRRSRLPSPGHRVGADRRDEGPACGQRESPSCARSISRSTGSRPPRCARRACARFG